MKTLLSVDLTEIFAALPVEGPPSQPGPGLRSRHTGFCWFAGPDYPDTDMLREHVRSADAPTGDVDESAFARALAKSAFNMSTDTGDTGDEPNPYTVSQDWDTAISTGPGEAKRQYLLESPDRNLVFTGSACLGSIVELMEIATALAVFGVDLNSDSPGGHWHYELLCAETSASLGEAVAICRKEYEAPHWLACGHYMGDAVNFALFHAEDANHDLTCTFEAPLMPTRARAGDTRQCFRAILFWRDAASTAAQ